MLAHDTAKMSTVDNIMHHSPTVYLDTSLKHFYFVILTTRTNVAH